MIILKKACLLLEPNDPEFIRVTHRTYEYVNENKDFDELYSTRFYGPMVFYLAWYKKMDHIIAHTINKANIDDCVDLIKLYLLLHGQEANSSQLINEKTSIEDFIEVIY